jgi:hypothetical protein
MHWPRFLRFYSGPPWEYSEMVLKLGHDHCFRHTLKQVCCIFPITEDTAFMENYLVLYLTTSLTTESSKRRLL